MEKYNGYTNQFTRAVALWINNDEDLYNRVRGLDLNPDPYEAAQQLKEFFTDELYPPLGINLYSDLLDQALAWVNWQEVYNAIFE